MRPTRPADRTGVDFALDVLGLQELRDAMPDQISQGQRKLVSAARAVAARPKMLCMDEPAAGLDTSESQDLGRRLRQIVDAGITVLLIDHDMGLVLDVCDEISVLEFGRRIAHGTPREIAADPTVIEAYLGATARRTEPT
ncbi:MAG: ATP-binding cassette domain-containing protein [Ilumatobacteraceae bacterium]